MGTNQGKNMGIKKKTTVYLKKKCIFIDLASPPLEVYLKT